MPVSAGRSQSDAPFQTTPRGLEWPILQTDTPTFLVESVIPQLALILRSPLCPMLLVGIRENSDDGVFQGNLQPEDSQG
jgi:hypothetical protein